MRSPRATPSRCSRMKANSSMPMKIFVHHELSVPSNVISVWIMPSTSTPSDGAEHVARPAGEQRAADDDRGDRVEFHADASEPQPGQRVEAQQDRRRARSRTR